MTFADKGHIFKLFDEGKTLEQISEITQYSETRLKFLVDAIKGTETWFAAISVYEEVTDYALDDKRVRTRHADKEKVRSTSKGLGGTKKSSRKKYSGIGATPTKVSPISSTKTRVSSDQSRRYKTPSQSRNNGNQSGIGSRRQSGGSLVKELRKSIDYVGE